jgi:starch synthase (maltosyl-transferring)
LKFAPALRRPAAAVPIALVITDLDVGGAERALVALATGLDRARWAPAVVCLAGEGVLADPLRAAGIPTTCLNARRWRPARAVLGLAGALRRQRPALVQSFLFHANLAARLAAPLAGRPWVVGGLRVAEHEKRWHLRLDRLTQRLTAGSVCVSRGVERFSRGAGGLDGCRLAVIPNGIDPAPYDRARPADRASLGIPPDALLALVVGRLERQKGVSVLLDALAADGPDLRLAVVGDGPEASVLRARTEADERLRSRVHWLGRRDDVPALLATADLLVLPSLWEGMPNAVLEAMAARRAVVATAVEGSDELVIPGETGWLVPAGDAPALAAALREAVADRERLRAFGAAGRERVERRFSQAAVVRAYDRLWSRLLGFEDGPFKTPLSDIR